jgi:monovalent cation:H+ antiporter-2, CPA2 family
MEHLAQIISLLGITVTVVLIFQHFHIPSSLGYLLVGVIVGPYTIGPTFYVPEFKAIAEFGVVFLLFTIGLNFSLPQLYALRHQVLGLGIGQVVFTTAIVAFIVWLAGVPAAAAFVVGAVFAQSSTTIIGKQLNEQNEENSPHGRFGLAMSVFQDVTAVPFLVIIPILGLSLSLELLSTSLSWALGKAVFAFALVFLAGRWLLRPLFHLVAARRSLEVFTLAVLLIALLAAWTTNSLGLSLAFGGFLAGMMLGETEFRHQVESSIRPFRDVLLGMFFVGIGMRIDPAALPPIWHWSILGMLLILISKTLIVMLMMRKIGMSAQVAWRTGLLLAVGGEFGFALLAIALDAGVIDMYLGQIVMSSVLLSMIVGSLLIRFNHTLALWLSERHVAIQSKESPYQFPYPPTQYVIIGGYGRVGHTIAVLLQTSNIPFMAFDTDPKKVLEGRKEGHSVMYGDISDPDLLVAINIQHTSLAVITVDDSETALRAVLFMRKTSPDIPIIARAWDIDSSLQLLAIGATRAYPEAIEASLRLGATALEMLRIAPEDIAHMMKEVRDLNYRPVLSDQRKD